MLRTIGACTAASNFGSSMLSAAFLIFGYRALHVPAVTLGLVLACANPGLIGAAFATRLTRRFGLGRTLVASAPTSGFAQFVAAALIVRRGAALLVLFVSELLQTCVVQRNFASRTTCT